MSNCSDCKVELNESNAYKKSETTYQSKCRTCFNKYCSDRWVKRKLKAIEYKGGHCSQCGYDKYHGALEFHHVNPDEKDMDWGKMRTRSWDSIFRELDKCVLLCANCHREVHNDERVLSP